MMLTVPVTGSEVSTVTEQFVAGRATAIGKPLAVVTLTCTELMMGNSSSLQRLKFLCGGGVVAVEVRPDATVRSVRSRLQIIMPPPAQHAPPPLPWTLCRTTGSLTFASSLHARGCSCRCGFQSCYLRHGRLSPSGSMDRRGCYRSSLR